MLLQINILILTKFDKIESKRPRRSEDDGAGKLELCRFRQSKDFSPIIADLDNDTGMIMDDITQYGF